MTKSFLKKALTVVGAALLALPLALNANVVSAAPANTQKVILTKLNSDQPTTQVDGYTKKDADKTLENVGFTAYNVTDYYWNTFVKNADAHGQKDADALSEMVNKSVNGTSVDRWIASDDGESATGDPTQKLTDANGQIAYDLPKTTVVHGKTLNSVYLFVETDKKEGYTPAANFVVTLPITAATETDGTAYVYPKDAEEGHYSVNFQKVDRNNTDTTLGGAVFYITQKIVQQVEGKPVEKTYYAQVTGDGVAWLETTEGATEFKSGEGDGTFGISAGPEYTLDGVLHGMKADGKYGVEEISAPAGYNKDAQINGTNVADVTVNPADKATKVTDSPKGLLPHTGGAGIVAFVVLGAALLTFGVVAYNKRRASF